MVPGDNRSLAMPYSRVVRVLHDLGVTLTWSLPTETLLWAAGGPGRRARAGARLPGAAGAVRRRRAAERRPGGGGSARSGACRWCEEYGSTETGSLAGQCPRGRLHLWADRAIFEVYDPAHGPDRPDGRGPAGGHAAATGEAMPLLRYNLEDDVEVSYQPCACGWQLPTVRVLGRSAFGYPVGRRAGHPGAAGGARVLAAAHGTR